MNLEKILNNAQKSKKKAHISATVSYDLKAKLDEEYKQEFYFKNEKYVKLLELKK